MNCIKVVGIREQWVVWSSLGLVLCLFGAPTLSAQARHIKGKSVYELRTDTLKLASPSFTLSTRRLFPKTVPAAAAPDLRRFMTTSAPYQAPSLYQYQDLAFFCRLEVKLEQSSKIPVRFRLGSVDYVDYMEGKRTQY